MEDAFFLGEIKAATYQSEKHCTIFSHTLKLYISRFSALNINYLIVVDE